MEKNQFHTTDLSKHSFLITGGAGFIGSHLSERLIKEGFNKIYLVDNLIRSNSLRNIPKNSNIEFVYGEVSTFDFSVFKDITHFFHLAATRINRCAQYNREGHEFITNSGFNVVDYCYKNQINIANQSLLRQIFRPKFLIKSLFIPSTSFFRCS